MKESVLVEVGALISWRIYSYRIVMLLVGYMWASMTFCLQRLEEVFNRCIHCFDARFSLSTVFICYEYGYWCYVHIFLFRLCILPYLMSVGRAVPWSLRR